MYIAIIWVLKSNGIHPQLCLLKIKYLLDFKVSGNVKTDDNEGMSDNSKKSVFLTDLVKQYKEFALSARKVVHFLDVKLKLAGTSGAKILLNGTRGRWMTSAERLSSMKGRLSN